MPPALPQNLILVHFLNYTKMYFLITQGTFYLNTTSHIKVFIYSINYSHPLLQAKYPFLIYASFIYSGHRLFGTLLAITVTDELLNCNLVL